MLREVKKIQGWSVHALDGEIGRVEELLFDDEHWVVRYVVVETGSWLAKRQVLLSPLLFTALSDEKKTLMVNLTQEKVKNSPDIASDPPVSQQWEGSYSRYDPTHSLGDDLSRDHAAAHLRSSREVTAYTVLATDGSLGHVDDFLVDDTSWKVVYLAVDTKDWLPGKKVLVPPTWIENVSWADRSVSVGATREHIKNAPEWQTSQLVTPRFEELLQAYYAYKNPVQASPGKNTFIALYDNQEQAEVAIRSLHKHNLDMTKLSLLGKNQSTDEEVTGYYTAGDQMKAWGKAGTFWGDIWSLLPGSAFFMVPGIGPILAAGPVVAWTVEALENDVVASKFSALGGALFSIGIPSDRVITYEEYLKAGKFLLIAHDLQKPQDAALIAEEIARAGKHVAWK
jgi:uncharacterized protein YrrD